jgi:uncharacterized Fe-S radical SAM superfamily protein PflX
MGKSDEKCETCVGRRQVNRKREEKGIDRS